MFMTKVLFDKAGDGTGGGGTGGAGAASGGEGANAGAGQPGSGASGGADGGAGAKPPGSPPGDTGRGNASDPLFGKSGDSGAGTGGRTEGASGAAGTGDSGQNGKQGAEGVKFPDNWKDALPDDLKNDGALGAIKDVPGLAKSFINAQKMIGADKVPIPGKHATEAEWNEVFFKLGNPRDPKEYVVELDPDSAKGMDTEFFEKFKGQAHKLGVLPKQAKAMADWFGKLNQEVWSSTEKEHEATIKAEMGKLQKDWGDDFDHKMTMARAAANEFTTKEERAWIQKTGLSQSPAFLRIMERMGQTLSEDKVRKHMGADAVRGGMSPAQANQKIQEINNNIKHPYWDKNHENHGKAKAEMADLYLQANPKKSS